MSAATFAMAVRLRIRSTVLTALGMAAVILMVGALFPSVGDSIGKLDVPEGVAELLGGADYGTIAGWMRSEIGAVYGPLVIAATAITAAAGSTAGEEESGVLALVLSHPIGRSRLVLEKAAAVALGALTVAVGTLLGLIAGVAVAGGGISLSHQVALVVHLAFFGFATGALALALAGVTGRRAVAAGGAGAFALLSFLINGFAPLVDGITWLKYVSPFYYYAGHDPLGNGVDLGDLALLAAGATVLTAIAVAGFQQRDLRA
jgi:ABC-2 type transport system permease protein